jgi:hypothetical protein
MTLFYAGRLPKGALIDAELTPPPARKIAAPISYGPAAPVIFTTSQGLSLNGAGRVTAWESVPPAIARAERVSFNDEGTGFDPELRALDFVAKTHGGLCVADVIPNGALFSIGLIYAPPPKRDAQTLLSLQAKGDDDYAFLSAEDATIRFALRGGDESLSVPDPQKLTLLVMSSDGRKVRLSVNRELAASVDCALPATPLDIFLGCRGGTRSLLGKLGSFTLTDMLVWPNEDVLAGEVTRAPTAALALWQERLRNGVRT